MCAWGNLLSFSVPWGTEKITESRFAKGISTQAGAMVYHGIFIYKYIYILVFLLGKIGWGARGRPVKTLFVSVFNLF